jgi:RimJ/RimL family protein N-acetyltransferase
MTVTLRPIGFDEPIAAVLAAVVPPADAATAALLATGLEQMRAVVRPLPWGNYLAWRDGETVGCCGFKNVPGPGDPPEIGYMTFPRAEGTGVATAMAGALVAVAVAHAVDIIIAHTLPVPNASGRALARNGFMRAGMADDPDEGPVWRWECNPL